MVCGHYGTGKTNLSINLALDAAERGEDVILIDLDIVNPYFRSADYASELIGRGVKVVGPNYANTNLDTPSLPGAVKGALNHPGRVIVDVGGDDVGATALGAYASMLSEMDPDVLYVVNRYRSLTTRPEEALEILDEIERSSRLKVTAVVNNSHLKAFTTAETVIDSMDFASHVAMVSNLPLRFTAVPAHLQDALLNKIPDMYPVDVHVRAPWE